MPPLVSITEDASTRQRFPEIVHDEALQNALLESFSKFLHEAKIYLALINLGQFFHHFSLFSTFFRYSEYLYCILVQNEYHIRNQHEKLHRIDYVSSKLVPHQKSTCIPPQPFSSRLLPRGPLLRQLTKRCFTV